jgi:unsaturated rhamnogalacturonyl hydrolase
MLGWSLALMVASSAWAQQPGRASTAAVPVAKPPMYEPVESDPVLNRVMAAWPEARIDTVKKPGEWSYEEGVLLDGMIAEWRQTGDGRLFACVKAAVDRSVDSDGVIHFNDGAAFPVAAHSLDNIEMGRSVVTLYRVTRDVRYYKAAVFLHEQMLAQPKNASGGYWHKQIYPNQMWLDGAYMAEPFMANYARTFHLPNELEGVASQLILMDTKMRDRESGLLRHGWDASKQMEWADKRTGLSPEVWARAMGWYAMALVDVLERMPATDPQRAAIEDLTRRTLTAVVKYQDTTTGLWWQVMDKGGHEGNYFEPSASCMFVYALTKAIRIGVMPLRYEANVTRGWQGVQKRFIKPDGTLSGTVKVAGLGGTPYRSGTYAYYTGEPVGDNDAKGVGAYLLALSEMTQRKRAGGLMHFARGGTVLMDEWFNSQKRKSADGEEDFFHYKFTDDADSGYSVAGKMFQQYGMRTAALDHAPRAEDLKGVAVYVIVSPDILALNPNLHYMDQESAAAIEAWVRAGGVLVLMENDSEHADQTHFDLLSDAFGIHFNAVTRNREINNDYANTLVKIPAATGEIFRNAHTGLMKETCTITVSEPAKVILGDHGDSTATGSKTAADNVLMAVAHVGKGLVYANVDPWIYNEYTDGRKAPLGEDNFAGGQELVRWIVAESVVRRQR